MAWNLSNSIHAIIGNLQQLALPLSSKYKAGCKAITKHSRIRKVPGLKPGHVGLQAAMMSLVVSSFLDNMSELSLHSMLYKRVADKTSLYNLPTMNFDMQLDRK
jgi:hypothetical protein